jgi:transglutaminase-like putative cysteine protease
MDLLATSTPAPPRQLLVLAQTIRYDYDVPVTRLQQRLVTVPPARHGSQRRRDWSIDVTGESVSVAGGASDQAAPVHRRRTHRDPFGNHVVEIEVPRVDDWVAFECRVTVDSVASSAPHRVRCDPRYGTPSTLTAASDEIRDLAAGGSVADIAARTYRALTYEWGITDVRTTAADALRGGVGVCQDYAHIMIAACRVAGVAARYVSGHLVGEGGSHAWVEVLTPDPARPGHCLVEGWDPTNDRRTDHSYLTVAVGRDYSDVAPLSGAYVADHSADALTVVKHLTWAAATGDPAVSPV